MMAKIIQIHDVSDSNEDRIYALADDGTLWLCHQEGSHRLIWKQIEPPPFGDPPAQETVPPQI